MVWGRRIFQNALFLFQLAEDAKPHGQHREKHPQAREALGIAKVNIRIRNQSHKPRRQRGYNRFQIPDLCSFPYVPTDVPERVYPLR